MVPDYLGYLNEVGLRAQDVDPEGIQLQAYVTYRVIGRDGKVIFERREPSRSLLAAYAIMQLAMWGAQSNTMTDTNGVEIQVNGASPGVVQINAGSGVTTYGIVVGSGSQTVSPLVDKLAAQIPNGTGSGQLVYQNMSMSGGVTISGNTTSFTFSRMFTNVSGNTITVTEVGIIAYISGWGMINVNTGAPIGSDYVLIAYDVPSSSISIPNGASLEVTYTFSVTT